MSVELSPIVAARAQGSSAFSVRSVDLHALGDWASPVAALDHFRVRGRPFLPHPHAGFSAVTYVFEDSKAALRSRDSLGDDVVVEPGGIVWTEAGRGVMHEELPASDDELHGLQIFVNLSAKNKLAAPRMLRLDKSDAPERRSDAGDRVRVIVGSYENRSSPLVPLEPFTLLDVELKRSFVFDLPDAHSALVYVLDGELLVRAGEREQGAAGEQAVAMGGGGRVTFEAVRPAHFVLLAGAEIREPVLAHGPFIMNEMSQIEAAVARYRAGDMGRLAPLVEDKGHLSLGAGPLRDDMNRLKPTGKEREHG